MSKGHSKRKRTLNKKLLALSIGFSIVIVFGLVAYKMFFPNQDVKFSLKAAIVDQLSAHYPNATFIQKATNLLTKAGFNVSYFKSEAVNVTFYKELIEGNYGIIIFRTHSAVRSGETIIDFFTSEQYDGTKYNKDPWKDGLLSKAEYFIPLGQQTEQFYFAITPNFIERFGSFPKSIIIAMGCSSLRYYCMAQAFLNRGAKAYVGWNQIVLPNDTDHETAKFLDAFLGQNKTLEDATATADPHIYRDPNTQVVVTSWMEFYPLSERELKISELIAEAKTSKTLETFEGSSFAIANAIVKSKNNFT